MIVTVYRVRLIAYLFITARATRDFATWNSFKIFSRGLYFTLGAWTERVKVRFFVFNDIYALYHLYLRWCLEAKLPRTSHCVLRFLESFFVQMMPIQMYICQILNTSKHINWSTHQHINLPYKNVHIPTTVCVCQSVFLHNDKRVLIEHLPSHSQRLFACNTLSTHMLPSA